MLTLQLNEVGGGWWCKVKLVITRMHSSRLRTIRCSGRLSCHAHPPATHGPLPCIPPPFTCMPPATHGPNTHAPHHVCPPRPCMSPIMHAPPRHAHPPPVDRMTDACENITVINLLYANVCVSERESVYV